MFQKCVLVIAAVALASIGVAADQNPRAISGRVQLGFVGTTSAPQTTPAGSQVLTRLEVQVWEPASSSRSVARLLNGTITFVVNCDFNANYRGPCWGTFQWTVSNIGTWAGFWSAPVMDLVTLESKMTMVGIGSGGAIEGKHLTLDGGSAPGDWYITMSALVW